MHAGRDVAAGFARFVDAARSDARLGERVGVQGNSFGGLFAAHLAATDDRVGACVINGAPPEPRVPAQRAPREQLLSLVGTDDETAAEGIVRSLAFDPDASPLHCPTLVLQGGRDPLVSEDEQRRFLIGTDPATSTMHLWADGELTAYNHAAERDALTADWFADHLRAR